MSRRITRRMDRKGLKILHANQYRLIQEAAVRARPLDGRSPPKCESGEAAPPTLLGGVNVKNIGKLDCGERKSAIGVDWLQGTIPFDRMDSLFQYLNQVCGGQPERYNHGFMGYQSAAEWHPSGIKVLWDVDQMNRDRHGNRIVLQLSGSSLAGFPAESLRRFMRDLACKFWFKGTRTDLAFDDYEKIVRPEEVNEHAKDGSYSGFRKHKFIGGSTRKGEATDEGIYFGTRGKDGGGKFLRCYAKDIESKGETDSVRWEVEFSKEKANAVFFDLAMSSDLTDFATKIALFIGGSIDFCERGLSGRINKADRLAFWEQILHHLGAASLRCPLPDGSIETSMDWVEVSVTPSLEKIRRAIGDDRYYEWLQGQMEGVELQNKAEQQIRVYHNVNGLPREEVPF